MPENNLPSAKPDPEVAPGEFDFAGPVTERPRVKRRALQQATTAKTIETPVEKVTPAASRPGENGTKASAAPTRPATSPTAATPPSSSTNSTRPKFASSTQPTSPHGTRPATLYYSSGSPQDKASTSPMKSTPSASSSSTTAASSNATTRPATTSAASTRPASTIDYRTNVERQSREQKSVGGILSILVYSLIALFVLGASLAGYGAYVMTKQLNQQSVTMSDFDKRYSADYKDINARLATTLDTLTQAQAQIGRQQELIVKQQDMINKLLSATDDNAAAIRQEKAARAQETANIRSRLKDLEYTGPTTRKY